MVENTYRSGISEFEMSTVYLRGKKPPTLKHICAANCPQPLIYGEGEGKPPEVKPEGDKKPEPRTYDQAKVDEIVGKTKAELQKKFDKDRAADLERMSKLETDAAAKADLEKQIEELNNRYKSKEELAAESFKKEQSKWQDEAKKTASERDNWRKKFEEQTLLSDLRGATSKKYKGSDGKDIEAFNSNQLTNFLKPMARIAEKLVDGKPTGEFETRVKINDAKGKELDITAEDAVKMMGEMPEHFNFFKAGIVGGINGNGQQGTGKDGLLGMTQEEFNKRYREGNLPKRK